MFSCCCHDSHSKNVQFESQDTVQQKKPSQQAKPSPNAKKCYRGAMQCFRNKDLNGALNNFKEADNAGHPKATAEVVKVAYLIGMQCKENHDYKYAFDMFEEAAIGKKGPEHDGLPDAQLELGMCYLTGQGVEQSKDQARIWFTHAANKGHRVAPAMLKIISGNPAKGIKIEIDDNDQVYVMNE